jgi:glycosidase
MNLQGDGSVLAFWLEKGFDGIRLDCANDLSFAICQEITACVRQRFPDAVIIGEVANFSLPWLKALDATQSYFFSASVKALKAGSISSVQFLRNMQTAYGSGGYRQFQMLSSHDTPRIHSEWKNCSEFLQAARRLQFVLPGIPMIYYGEEFAMNGGRDPGNRAGITWEKTSVMPETDEAKEMRFLAALRLNSPEIVSGSWFPVFTDGWPDIIAFYWFNESYPERLTLVTFNNSGKKCCPTLTVPCGWLFSEVQLEDVFSGRRTTAVAGMVGTELEPYECAVWQTRDGRKKNYSFFKNWKSC